MPDLDFLSKLPPLLQIIFGIPIAMAGYFVWTKGVRDKLVAPPVDHSADYLGPVGKHLELMERIADGLDARREVTSKIDRLEVRIREYERAFDRLPRQR